MTQMKHGEKFNWRNLSATRVIAATNGVLAGFYGMEHGFFEILQGNVATNSLVIDAIGPAHEFWPGAMEPAFTIIPNFFITGILAMIVGFLVIIWAGVFIERKYGTQIMLLLSIILFLVGGGFGQLFNGIIASILATRINKPLSWWRNHLSDNIQSILVKLWPWALITYVVCSLVILEIAIFGYPLAWFFTVDAMYSILLAVPYIFDVVLVAAILSAFTYDIQKSNDS